MRNPVYLLHLFANAEHGPFVEHRDELNLHEVSQQIGAIPTQGGATS